MRERAPRAAKRIQIDREKAAVAVKPLTNP